MSEVNLKTERFDICRTVAMKFGRTVVDDTLIVPDIKPDKKDFRCFSKKLHNRYHTWAGQDSY